MLNNIAMRRKDAGLYFTASKLCCVHIKQRLPIEVCCNTHVLQHACAAMQEAHLTGIQQTGGMSLLRSGPGRHFLHGHMELAM